MGLVIFDFDGTICDTKNSILSVIKLTYRSVGVSTDENLIIDTLKLGCTLEETFLKISSKLDLDLDRNFLVTEYRDLYNKDAYKYTSIYDGVIDLICYLYEENIPLLILSNKGSQAINKILRFNNIDKYITEVIGADSCEFKKPDKRLFSDVISIRYPNIDKDNIYIIGDTDTDINFAKNANLKSCFVKYGYGKAEDYLCLNPDFVIDSCSDLYRLKKLFR